MASDLETRIRHVTAVLGPTNTGKTHLAIERMLGHDSGMIGLPLRLLAREVYDKIVARVGADKVALITGEEKIKPERARYWVCTVEAMPRDVDVDFLAIDEIQLAADLDRGHVFTDRLLHARGRSETLLLGAQTMRQAIADLIPGANFISRPRLSQLSYSGQKKLTRLPQRSAIVAFSAAEVYSIAELVRRQRGGAAVVLGALSPRTRNAQVALYQSGDVDYLVATDAIGMGLNLDVDHVAFSATRKFDGQTHRNLTPAELSQIAGRAGRHMNDGTFGVTGTADPFDSDTIERLETHNFDGVRMLQWRNRDLDFRTLEGLKHSLRATPGLTRLTRARAADDVIALETVSADREISRLAIAPAAVVKLWEVCQIPDYRKISGQSHAELVASIYTYLMGSEERIPEDWFSKQVALADRTDGDIDTLANRIAHIRTWTFVSNRSTWLKDPEHWQGKTREIEDRLSDALHEQLTQRFVDLRTSALMKGMRDKDELTAEIAADGAIHVENHFVGRLQGFRFQLDPEAAEGVNGKAMRNAAAQVLGRELGMRARRVAAAQADALQLARHGRILWRGEEIAQIEAADDALKPRITLLVDEHFSAPDREKVQARLESWLSQTIAEKLKPLVDIGNADDISGLARGIAFRLRENFGVLRREDVSDEVKTLDQNARAQLRKYGVRFGAFNIYFPVLLKPAAAELILALWALKNASAHGLAIETLPEPPRAGLTSFNPDPAVPEPFYRAFGYHVCGPRAVRFDMLERLADHIRPLLAWRSSEETMPPKGATGDGGFTVTPEMMSLLGCSPDELAGVLKALGFRLERRPVKAQPQAAAEASTTAAPAEAATAEGSEAPSDAAAVEAVAPASEAETPSPVPTEAVDEASVQEGAPASSDADASEAATSTTAEAGDAVTAGSVAAASAEASAEEEKFEEVWRPRRHQRNDRREQGRQRRPDNRRGRGAPQAAASTAAGGEASAAAAAAPAGAEGGAGRGEAGERQQRRDGGRDNRRGGQQRNAGGKREHGGGGRDQQRDGGNRGNAQQNRRGGDRNRRDDRNKDDRRKPAVHTAAAPRRGGAIDPDSPFAALGALREELAKRGKETST
ncbi:ATP-dependent DNA helicase [Hyphomicrobium sulfonivorans]|uniref:ATP-dependent DNA helicase n=1 Tax=Hyphomicrobium sulfonivorans TaxID=121290 RepID=A0A109BCD4_HYPSL|nr:helicase-related protein [Hyphomicrobium sulfonivorans]KWT66203.1 ATP-dependent DNA helicase [Hyphomicrobium sulfonivorans]